MELLKNIRGDRTLWVISILLALGSMFPVYSASSNIAFLYRDGDTFAMLFRHFLHLLLGLVLMYITHRTDYRHLGALSKILMPVVILLLGYTLMQGVSVSNASRWIKIPFTNTTFQTSALALVVLPIYLSRGLAKAQVEELRSFRASFFTLIAPILLVCLLVLPANFSTAALIFTSSMLLLFVGGYPLKNLGILIGSGIVGLALFLLVVLAFPQLSNRVSTWQARIENFSSGSPEENYQVHKAKMAIAEGQLFGKGPGKSMQKNFLPQSNSDFIYAIIVEEFGTLGGVLVVLLFVMLLIRLLIIATRAATKFGSLVVIGIGTGILLQAFVNLGVAVNLFPVTGQTLPMISAGGSSIWMTCIALGIILSVSAGKGSEPSLIDSENPLDTNTKKAEQHVETA